MDQLAISEKTIEEISKLRNEPDWLLQKRIEAWKIFQQTKEIENVDEISPNFVADYNIGAFDENLKFDFHYLSELKIGGIIITDILRALKDFPDFLRQYFLKEVNPLENNFVALHTALFNTGAFIYVPAGIELKVPLGIRYSVTKSNGFFNHNVIVVDKGASLAFIEDFSSKTKSKNAIHTEVSEIYLKEGAQADYLALQDWQQNISNFSIRRAVLEKDSKLKIFLASLGSNVSKINIDTLLKGPNAETEVYSMFLGTNNQNFDIKTSAIHSSSETKSLTLVNGVLKETSVSNYKGKIKVLKDATKCDAHINENVLLLGSEAHAEFVPNLEIENGEVSASHDAFIRQADKERLNFLISKGMKKEDAEKLMVQEFFEDVLQKIPLQKFSEKLQKIIQERLS